jgi:S1-C subfamily serine protease
MTRKSIRVATALAWLAMAAWSPSVRAELQPEDLYSAVSPSVVALEVENVAGRQFIGTAFLALGDHLAVTAWHVIHDARRVEARFADHQRVKVLGVVDKNEKLDLALIRLEGAAGPKMTLSSTCPRIGSRVYVVGSPRGLDFSISEGLISQIRTLDGVRYYQLSCPISPGDSGGPVLNNRGEAIGAVSWRKADAENVGFAIPSPAIARMNATLAPVAWSGGAPAAQPTAGPADQPPLVHNDVRAAAPGNPDPFRDFQQFLTGRAGQPLNVIVLDHGKESRFHFEVPAEAAKWIHP